MAATLLVWPATASARIDQVGNPALTYVEARAAAIGGEHSRSALLLAMLSSADTADGTVGKKALAEAISAGDIPLALDLARRLPAANLSTDGRLLLAADELRRGRPAYAAGWLSGATGEGKASLAFLVPLVTMWGLADQGDATGALAALDGLPATSPLTPFRAEQRAYILLKFHRAAEAEPFARRAIGNAGSRETRLRMALADGFLASGDRPRALAMVDGIGTGAEATARRLVDSGKPSGLAVDNGAKAYAELLVGLAADVTRANAQARPIGLVQVARYAAPDNSAASLLLAMLLDSQKRPTDSLALLHGIATTDPLSAQARDIEVRVLDELKRLPEALAIAQAAVASGGSPADYSRLGDVYQSLKRHGDAAAAYGQAVSLASAAGPKDDLWPLLLEQASALEDAKRWPEARQALTQALAIAPDEPLLLNFMGYAKLEHGEDLDAAEAMIRKASALAPDNASITDSLGWALFKRGRTEEAITSLELAADKDSGQAEIREHLGDALYTSGRHYEARFAWRAALVAAEDDMAARVNAKLAAGLNPSNAAP